MSTLPTPVLLALAAVACIQLWLVLDRFTWMRYLRSQLDDAQAKVREYEALLEDVSQTSDSLRQEVNAGRLVHAESLRVIDQLKRQAVAQAETIEALHGQLAAALQREKAGAA